MDLHQIITAIDRYYYIIIEVFSWIRCHNHHGTNFIELTLLFFELLFYIKNYTTVPIDIICNGWTLNVYLSFTDYQFAVKA